MAVGDVVNGLSGLPTTYIFFQPAVGVEAMISFVSSHVAIADGTNTTSNMTGNDTLNMKIFINNTIYLRYYGASTGTGFTGIQIK
jgi:hypothetical protein|tara:strand:+ start:775 stop:1029 length:255 start_codon:yes stop_codon:yes gene_type:complete